MEDKNSLSYMANTMFADGSNDIDPSLAAASLNLVEWARTKPDLDNRMWHCAE